MRANRASILCLLALVGCGPKEVTKFDANPPAPPTLAGNWRWHQMQDIGAMIAAPTEWRTPAESLNNIDTSNFGGEGQVQVTDEQLKQMGIPDEMMKQREEHAKLPEGTSLLLSKRGIVGETSTITQIELKHHQVKGGTTLKEQADEIANIYMGSAKRSTIKLPVGPAELIKMTTKSRDGETGHHIHYVMVNNEDVYVLTLQTEQAANVISDDAQAIAESFRLAQK
ncbi:MAG: hypothetical protein JSS66_11805 [Armatimonadetes bacterium]|nr:hypothetical protein [Armatimonadota bacterium]